MAKMKWPIEFISYLSNVRLGFRLCIPSILSHNNDNSFLEIQVKLTFSLTGEKNQQFYRHSHVPREQYIFSVSFCSIICHLERKEIIMPTVLKSPCPPMLNVGCFVGDHPFVMPIGHYSIFMTSKFDVRC